MEISDVHVKIIRNSTDRLKAVCTITFESEFVVRDVKVVEGTNGMFVAMPSRKLSVHCKTCSHKNHLRAKYCNECGTKLDHKPVPSDTDGRTRLHRDIAHPITPAFRELVQERVIKAYEEEYEKNKDSITESDHAEVEQKIEEESTEPTEPMDEYDEIIANLKGSRRSRSEKEDKSSHRASPGDDKSSDHTDDDHHPDADTQSESAIVVDHSDDDETSSDEKEEPTTMIQSEQESESVRQAARSESDSESSFGEGIL